MCSSRIRDQRGFTLIELIAVMLILGVMAAVAVVKYHSSDMAETAAYRKLVPLLNADEKLHWSSIKLDGTYTSDSDDVILQGIKGRPGVTFKSSDGDKHVVEYNNVELTLTRTISNRLSSGHWY